MQFSLIEKINVNQPIQPTSVRMIFLDVDDPTHFFYRGIEKNISRNIIQLSILERQREKERDNDK